MNGIAIDEQLLVLIVKKLVRTGKMWMILRHLIAVMLLYIVLLSLNKAYCNRQS
uniref:Bm300 n=1 Tax=Brugia malayi TaxID=6279 RepID=A0A0J9XP39_BRUMA|nr:Bm300 [Brugia malayi]